LYTQQAISMATAMPTASPPMLIKADSLFFNRLRQAVLK
jgi:hypothetical protein